MVTGICFDGGRSGFKSQLSLSRCVLYTGANGTSLSGWLCASNEIRYGECLWVCSGPLLNATSCHSSHFSFLLTCRSHVYSLHLVLAPSSGPSWFHSSFHQWVQCNQSLEMALTRPLQNPAIRPVMGHVGGSRGCKFWKLHSEFYQRRRCVFCIPSTIPVPGYSKQVLNECWWNKSTAASCHQGFQTQLEEGIEACIPLCKWGLLG